MSEAHPLEIIIRRAATGEAGVLTCLALRSKQSNGYDDQFMAACREELTVHEEDLTAHMVLVAEGHDQTLLGFVILQLTEDPTLGEVRDFFVDPRAKRSGVGRALWAHLKRHAIGLDIRRLFLDADPHATAFYEAMGFAITGEVPSGSIAGRQLPRMETALDQPL
ncbi:MAG: GNAT family N-acetyltransferase [Alphaproteobacteria bacterium]|nr:MAG: GNAT family N-acetyltransferase [Alphaproteobacteria bacterium]